MMGGFDNLESLKLKVKYVTEKRLAGIMWWALDMDDFSGEFCGQGRYPLISSTWNILNPGHGGQNPTSSGDMDRGDGQ